MRVSPTLLCLLRYQLRKALKTLKKAKREVDANEQFRAEYQVALETLVKQAGGTVAGKLAILAEGDATVRDDLVYLEKLPLFARSPEGKFSLIGDGDGEVVAD